MTDSEAIGSGLAALRAGVGEETALARLASAIRPSSTDARAWQVLGLLHRAVEELGPAIDAIGRAAALAPADARIAHGLAQARLDAGLDAVAAFERAVAIAPGERAAAQGLAAAKAAIGDRDGALADLDAVLARDPQWIEGHWLASRLRWMQGDAAGHLVSLDRALAAAPRDLMLWQARLMIQMRATHFRDALVTVAAGRRAAGPDPLFDIAAATALSESGEAARADPLFARLPPPADLSDAVQRIRHALRVGRPEEAIGRAEPLSTGDTAPFVWPYLAVAWRLIGDPRSAWLAEEVGVGIYDLAGSLPPLDALAERLRAIHRAGADPLEQSLRGGTQTDGPLFSGIEPEVRALRATVVEAVERHIASLPAPVEGHPQFGLRRDRSVRFAGAWSVRLLGGGHHVNHVHPEGWFSSALYVALPDEVGEGSTAGWLSLGEPEVGLGVDLPPLRLVEPKPGRLVLFPGTLWHGTRPFADGERLTVAFDVARPR